MSVLAGLKQVLKSVPLIAILAAQKEVAKKKIRKAEMGHLHNNLGGAKRRMTTIQSFRRIPN